MVLLYTVVYGNDLTRKKGVVSCLDVLFDGDEQNNNVEQLSVLVLVWPVVYKIQLVKAQKKDLHIFEMEATYTAVLPNTKYTSGDSSQQQRGMYLTWIHT